MLNNKPIDILIDSLDQLIVAPYLAIFPERYELTQSLIATLTQYPRPSKKGDSITPVKELVAAYMFTSTARNLLKLAQLGYVPFVTAFSIAENCFEAALSLHEDRFENALRMLTDNEA